jgi:hypothetical protein
MRAALAVVGDVVGGPGPVHGAGPPTSQWVTIEEER